MELTHVFYVNVAINLFHSYLLVIIISYNLNLAKQCHCADALRLEHCWLLQFKALSSTFKVELFFPQQFWYIPKIILKSWFVHVNGNRLTNSWLYYDSAQQFAKILRYSLLAKKINVPQVKLLFLIKCSHVSI